MTIGEDHESQLELFQVPPGREARPAWAVAGNVQIRQDHLVLWGIITLIGLSVVFAAGVERGKGMARAQQPLLGSEPNATASVEPAPVAASAPSSRVNARKEEAAATPAPAPNAAPTAPRAIPRKAPKSLASGPAASPAAPKTAPSRFVVQVVSYQQPSLAKRELSRLKGRGEPAFLLEGENATALLVGPFPTKQKAKAKLSNLQTQYQGCFVRSL